MADLLKEGRKRLILDLSGVSVVDSTGIGILVMCFAKVKKAGGSLRVAGATGMVEETLKITTLDRLIELYPTVSEASRGF